MLILIGAFILVLLFTIMNFISFAAGVDAGKKAQAELNSNVDNLRNLVQEVILMDR